MTRRFGGVIGAILALALTAAAPGVAEAGFLQAWSGNTNAGPAGGTQDFTANFAVYQRNNSDPVGPGNEDPYGVGDTAFLGEFVPGQLAPLAAFEQEFLYLYQLVNNGSGITPTNQYTIQLDDGVNTVMDFGHFAGYVFEDNNGSVGENNENTVDNDFGNDTRLFLDPGVPQFGVTSPGVTVVGDAVTPTLVQLATDPAERLLRVQFSDQAPAELIHENRSVIFGFTSYLPPKLTESYAIDSGIAFGAVPAPVPEPSVLVMAIGGVLAGAVVGLRRRRTA